MIFGQEMQRACSYNPGARHGVHYHCLCIITTVAWQPDDESSARCKRGVHGSGWSPQNIFESKMSNGANIRGNFRLEAQAQTPVCISIATAMHRW